MPYPIARIINLIDPAGQRLWTLTESEARARLLESDLDDVLAIDGSFALVAVDGDRVCLARSLDRPLRYFLAKDTGGPVLVVADRIDAIQRELQERGWAAQFHPSYTRMVPAHHVTTLRLLGCPDPNPIHRRFFDPPRGILPPEPAVIGAQYIAAVYDELRRWLGRQDAGVPLGVMFSGGIDSGAVLLCLYRLLLDRGESPARLKAFTLSIGPDGGGNDQRNARDFLRRVDLEWLGEVIDVPADSVNPLAAVELIEDYKPLDVECAAATLALMQGIRARYPDWRLLVDGDGGDENLKDYPIEANSELTIRSVVNNRMLYQEGWGVDSIKHSMVYTGGYSRACVRSFAPRMRCGFDGFSPYTRPAVVQVAEAIPFADLTQGSTERLYALKGEIIRHGVHAVTGLDLPIFPKQRFQAGAASAAMFSALFGKNEDRYRSHFLSRYSPS